MLICDVTEGFAEKKMRDNKAVEGFFFFFGPYILLKSYYELEFEYSIDLSFQKFKEITNFSFNSGNLFI